MPIQTSQLESKQGTVDYRVARAELLTAPGRRIDGDRTPTLHTILGFFGLRSTAFAAGRA